MTGNSLTQQLADYLVAQRAAGIPDDYMRAAKHLFLDWLGSALAGTATAPGRMLLTYGQERAPGQATVMGLDQCREPQVAAFVNGALSHIVEMDDLHRASVLHPAAVVMPAALAAGEKQGASGRDVLTAIVLGYEVAIRVGEAVGQSHYRVWHTTATCGTFGAAAAAGALLQLSSEQMTWALGNAGSQAAGLWEFVADGAMTKHLHAGKAAANGLLAAELAEKGFTGPVHILEGDRGFFTATSSDARPARVVEGLYDATRPLRIAEVSVKPHASCRHTHAAVDAALALRHTVRSSDEIQAIEIESYRTALDVCDNPSPASQYAAKFSLQYCVACALVRGSVGLGEFDDATLRDPAIRRLISITTVSERDDLNRQYPAEWPSAVKIRRADGSESSRLVFTPRGDPENPLSQRDLEEKFRALVATTAFSWVADPFIAAVSSMDSLDTISRLFEE